MNDAESTQRESESPEESQSSALEAVKIIVTLLQGAGPDFHAAFVDHMMSAMTVLMCYQAGPSETRSLLRSLISQLPKEH